MALVIAMTNHKGGVGKTASVSALGTVFARKGKKVLMVDLDGQANLTFSFLDPAGQLPERTVYDAIRERKNLPQVCLQENLYLAPSSFQMTFAEYDMFNAKRREYILQDLLVPLDDKYDVIFLDCPPSLGIVTLNGLVVADRVSVPMHADQLSYYGLKMMIAYVEGQRDLNPTLEIRDIFFTHYNRTENQTKRIEGQVREEFGDILMESKIHKNVAVGEAVSSLCSVVDYRPESTGAKDYVALAEELILRIF